ncbi:sugar phosphate isomerase/epimerase family protein [Leifsonia shinshuensis]|nr:sugar phosphate isomerase/epimerase [Leifsonia shinshuensis]
MADILATEAPVRLHDERPSLQTAPVLEPAYAPDAWPIAAAMLQFPGVAHDGRPIGELAPDEWRALLEPVPRAGYTALEVPSSWIRLADLESSRRREFADVLASLGLSVPGLSVVRESVIHPVNAARNLDFSHRTIDAAAELGVPLVCFGLHDKLLPRQQEVQWFWTVEGTQESPDPDVRELAVRSYRELGQHAASLGLQISLELYEDGYLGSADGAVRFLEDIDEPAVGLNPDLGNLIRQQRPIDTWEYMVATTLPHANYWHVKNYSRLENPEAGIVLTHPTPLELGIINYRDAVRYAIAHGFSGAFVVEHYGGDGLSVGATNEAYLRSILPPQTV